MATPPAALFILLLFDEDQKKITVSKDDSAEF
jgi:hypothetical protein